MPNKLIRYLGELPEGSWDPAMFSHRRLTSLGRRMLRENEVFDVGMDDGDFPQTADVAEQARGMFDTAMPRWRHARETGGGVLAGKGSVSAHNDGTPGWSVFTLTWLKELESASLQVGAEHLRLEPGSVIAFRAGVVHSWVCHCPWTAVFMDLDPVVTA
jgi:hypothetical protein